MKKYAIWNKEDAVITPIGEVLSAEQWKARYPVAALPSVTVICAAGEVNGAFFGTLGQMQQLYEAQGADFSECESAEDKLEVIEAFEDAAHNAEEFISPEERIAAALEAQVMLALPDEVIE